ncbi:hypothetical protein VSDG_06419 [Cytospora chrysosperma]|uniref:Heterokaryon incompatibility domain-containing protein n=1 Tax=Cytospora chrysosperma TaxID=252740 RepID=A0A423VPG0_CYTCH|nr:hypothetical protein VSDG_06419 [Valsa sordida]
MQHSHVIDCDAPSDRLCDTCCILNLSPHRFVRRRDASGDVPVLLSSGWDPVGLKARKLGYLDQIYHKKDQCSICWLLFQATHSSGEDGGIGYDGLDEDDRRVECYVSWQPDGRFLSADGEISPVTRRLRVFNPEGLFPEAYIMLSSGDNAAGDTSPSFLGRSIPRDRVNVDTVRKWLDLCREHHDETCKAHSTGLSHDLITSSRLRLIDLQEDCLVTFEPLGDVEYATLSYVWGSSLPTCLTTESFADFSTPGSLNPCASNLPNTIRDAMVLVRSLGIRYVWIDSLCIIQDDEEDWRYTSSLMGRVYGNGIVNICAAAGEDCRHGIPGTQLTPRDAVQPLASVADMNLLVVKPVESLIQNSEWDRRAWTFQERMLSPRCLVFTEGRAFFQCRQATWSEEVESESSLRSWTLDMIRSPLESVEKNPVRLFMDYVELYSRRLLTYKSDRLAAFAGSASVLCPPLRAHLLYGLPNSYFDFALLWDHKDPGHRIKRQMQHPFSFWVEFPSWSWCGWEGTAEWRISMVSSCLLNLQEWLAHHTWIVWYAYFESDSLVPGAISPSDEVGIAEPGLRLVWQKSSHQSGSPDRWHGYFSASNMPYGRSLGHKSEKRPTYPTSTALHNGWLYFWTYTAFFQLSRKSLTSPEVASKMVPGLYRFGLLGDKGDWCGTIVLPKTWYNRVGETFEFAAISDAREFSMEELDTWNHDIHEDRGTSEWYLYYALLIVWDEKHTVAERAGIAKIYQKAFDTGSFEPKKDWREIALR